MTAAFLRKLAGQVPGLDLAAWSTDRFKPSLGRAQVQNDERTATRQLPLVDGGRGTPGLIMSGPRGTRFVAEGLVGYAKLGSALAAVS